jgi:hypothetical protein
MLSLRTGRWRRVRHFQVIHPPEHRRERGRGDLLLRPRRRRLSQYVLHLQQLDSFSQLPVLLNELLPLFLPRLVVFHGP